MVNGYAATEPRGELKAFEYELGPLGDHQVDIEVEYCAICHSDLSMLDNDWGFTQYPFVPGHEIVGKVDAIGANVKGVTIGQRVGLGWYSGSCMMRVEVFALSWVLCRMGRLGWSCMTGVTRGRHASS